MNSLILPFLATFIYQDCPTPQAMCPLKGRTGADRQTRVCILLLPLTGSEVSSKFYAKSCKRYVYKRHQTKSYILKDRTYVTLRDRQDNWMKTEVRRAVTQGMVGHDVGAGGLVVYIPFLDLGAGYTCWQKFTELYSICGHFWMYVSTTFTSQKQQLSMPQFHHL